jgi:rhomboid protease GluP
MESIIRSLSKNCFFLVILFLNTLVFILQLFNLISIESFAFKLDHVDLVNNLLQQGQLYRYLISAFMHGSVLHIGLNMFAFQFLFFELKKLKVSQKKIALIYFLSIPFSLILVVLLGKVPSFVVGASGALFGLIGLYTFLSFRNRLYSKIIAIGIELIMQVFIAFLVPIVSWQAHLGGFLTGLLFGFFL